MNIPSKNVAADHEIPTKNVIDDPSPCPVLMPGHDDRHFGLDALEFAPLRFAGIIPRDLIESVKGRTFTVDQFVKYQESQVDNPYNHLFALVDPAKKIQGYLWAESNVLDGSLFVNTFSVAKEYWGKGAAIEKAVRFIGQLRKSLKAPRVYWMTTNERFFAKRGFKRSKMVLMEAQDHPQDNRE